MDKNNKGYALCGTLINVTAGDVIETSIRSASQRHFTASALLCPPPCSAAACRCCLPRAL